MALACSYNVYRPSLTQLRHQCVPPSLPHARLGWLNNSKAPDKHETPEHVAQTYSRLSGGAPLREHFVALRAVVGWG